MHNKKILPPTYFFITLLTAYLLYLFIPVQKIITYPWNVFGIIPGIAGAILNMIADKDFKKAGTTVKPFEKTSTLITRGVYRISRNPMYLGMLLILISATMITGSLSSFFVIPLFIILIQNVFIKEEEKMLAEEFGEDWESYKKKVRRWI